MKFPRLSTLHAIAPVVLYLLAFNAAGQAGSPKGPLSSAALRELEAEVRKAEAEAKASEQQAQRAEGQARAKADTAVRAAEKELAAAEKREREETARIAKAAEARRLAEEKRAKEEAELRFVPYAALAVGTKWINHGWARDAASLEEAERVATRNCEHSGDTCSVVLAWSGHACGAYRTSQDGEVYGWGTARLNSEAASAAFDDASRRSKGGASHQITQTCNNRKSSAPLQVLVQKPANIGGPGECLLQFQANFKSIAPNGQIGNWEGRYYSPVYQLKGSDCPRKVGAGEHEVYFHAFPPHRTHASDTAKALQLDPTGRGPRMAEEFRAWLATKRSPAPGTVYEETVSATFTHVKPEPTKALTENVSILDAGMDKSKLRPYFPLCFDFKPSGVTPIKVHAAEYCKTWVR
jgi:hypothetical protein